MGWEKGRYYTRSRKVKGRVVRECIGAGRIGELTAELDAIDRERRDLKRHEARSLRAELAEGDAALKALGEKCDLLVRATLIAASPDTKGTCNANSARPSTKSIDCEGVAGGGDRKGRELGLFGRASFGCPMTWS